MSFSPTVCRALAAACLASPLAASAASVSAILYGVSDTPAAVSPGTNTLTINLNGQVDSGAYVGQLNWHNATSADWNDGLNPQLASILGPNATFATYCIDVGQNVFFGQSSTWSYGALPLAATPKPGAGMGATQAGEVSEFWNRYYDLIGTGVGADVRATAFQLGLWELTNDGLGADPFSSGTFMASAPGGDPSAITLATQWLGDVGGTTPYVNQYTLYTLADDGLQDQVFAVRATPLPSAGTMGLSALGAMALATQLRRKRIA